MSTTYPVCQIYKKDALKVKKVCDAFSSSMKMTPASGLTKKTLLESIFSRYPTTLSGRAFKPNACGSLRRVNASIKYVNSHK